ncbi:glycosyltransferase [Methylohalobius crimeensis]|uniref:glycosyltransferase n=1 Tax=Methylohalobius crimeensis TaxID=244365 RepID=UPI0003B5C163|nr:glycosyltransferase [Methylohalobius crimeensis]
MTDKLDISVVIAVYNGEKTLARAIDSVLEQTHPAREIIVVDDGSTDATAGIAAAYGPPVFLLQQPNRGVSAARNAGVEAAQGEWIAFLDADDYYYPQRLGLTAELIAEYPEVDFVTADFDFRDENDRRLRRSMDSTVLGKKLLKRGDDRFVLMEASDFGDFIEDHFGDTHTLTLPKETFMDLGGYPDGFAVCEDVHLLIRLCTRSCMAGVVKTPVAAYVIHPHSATRSQPLRAQRQTVAAWCSLKPLLAKSSPALKGGFRNGLRRARFNLAVALLRSARGKEALQAVLPLLFEAPSISSLKIIASVLKG